MNGVVQACGARAPGVSPRGARWSSGGRRSATATASGRRAQSGQRSLCDLEPFHILAQARLPRQRKPNALRQCALVQKHLHESSSRRRGPITPGFDRGHKRRQQAPSISSALRSLGPRLRGDDSLKYPAASRRFIVCGEQPQRSRNKKARVSPALFDVAMRREITRQQRPARDPASSRRCGPTCRAGCAGNRAWRDAPCRDARP